MLIQTLFAAHIRMNSTLEIRSFQENPKRIWLVSNRVVPIVAVTHVPSASNFRGVFLVAERKLSLARATVRQRTSTLSWARSTLSGHFPVQSELQYCRSCTSLLDQVTVRSLPRSCFCVDPDLSPKRKEVTRAHISFR